mgnify:FL=1
MVDSEIYLDTYVLQQDMRIRLPKSVISNLSIEKGKTKFDIYLDSEQKSLILRVHENNKEK